jgi:hypothetical protein
VSFEKTGFAQKLFGADIPNAVRSLQRIAEALERGPRSSVFIVTNQDGAFRGVFSTKEGAMALATDGQFHSISEHEVQ